MSIIIRDATQEDLDYVKQNPINAAFKDYPELKLLGYAKAAFIDGDCIGVGGAVLYWEGHAEGWLYLSKKVLEHPVEMAFYIKTVVNELIKEMKLRRLDAHVRCDFERGIRLLETLGFKRETPEPMEYYNADGSSAYLYAKIIGEM
jgi:hypothetical protein